VINIYEEKKSPNDSAKLQKLHHQFNCISFGKIKPLACAGVVDPRLANVPAPCCSACLYGKAMRRAWRSKPKKAQRQNYFKAVWSGQVVLVDMMHSLTPSLVAQMAGGLTKKHFCHAAVHIDHYLGAGYVH
jgi:hypothetical protein